VVADSYALRHAQDYRKFVKNELTALAALHKL